MQVDSPGVKRARYARSRSRDRAERMAEERPRQRQRSPAGEAYPLEVILFSVLLFPALLHDICVHRQVSSET